MCSMNWSPDEWRCDRLQGDKEPKFLFYTEIFNLCQTKRKVCLILDYLIKNSRVIDLYKFRMIRLTS